MCRYVDVWLTGLVGCLVKWKDLGIEVKNLNFRFVVRFRSTTCQSYFGTYRMMNVQFRASIMYHIIVREKNFQSKCICFPSIHSDSRETKITLVYLVMFSKMSNSELIRFMFFQRERERI
jgi:hypothetical protein